VWRTWTPRRSAPAGITAGSWYASPATHVGYELIGAGMLILAGGGRGLPMDYDELERWTRVGFERGYEVTQGRAVNGGVRLMRLLGIEWFAGGTAGRPPRLALPP
jgi:hypothetical protein